MDTRDIQIEHTRADNEARTVPVVLSTDTPVTRYDYVEVLGHDPSNVDLSRAPLPFIESHDHGTLNIGIVEQLRLHAGKLRGVLRLGTTERASEILADIEAGIVRGASIGYEVLKHTLVGDETVLVTKWRPLEMSAVAIPADPNAGFYRQLASNSMNEATASYGINDDTGQPLTRSERKRQREEQRSDQRAAELAVKAERHRVSEIEALGRNFDNVALAQRAIDDGTPLDDFRQDLIESIGTGRKQNETVRRHQSPAPGGYGRPGGFSIISAIRGLIDPRQAGVEREISQDLERHQQRIWPKSILIPTDALATRQISVGGDGASLVGTDHLASNFIENLRQKSFFLSAGTRMLTGLVGNVSIPRRASSGTAQFWLADGGDSLSVSNSAYDAVQLEPHNLGLLCSWSLRLMQQSDPSIETLVRDDIQGSIGVALDQAMINGSGVGAEPAGILQDPNIILGTDWSGASPTRAELLELMTAMSAANSDSRYPLSWWANSTIWGLLQNTLVDAGSGAFLANATNEPGMLTMLNKPGYDTASMPDDTIMLLAAGDCMAGFWGQSLELVLDEVSQLESGVIRMRGNAVCDVALRNSESCATSNNIP